MPDHSKKAPFQGRLTAEGDAANFKRHMMIELARRFRMPAGWAIDYDGYWSEALRE